MSILLLLVGCAKPPPTHHGPAFEALAPALIAEGVVVQHTVVVQDLASDPLPPLKPPSEIELRLRTGEEHLGEPTVLDPTTPEHASFLRNDYVGAVRFGGGLIRTGETALETRARFIEFSAQGELRALATAWLDETTAALIVSRKIPVLPQDTTLAAPTVTRKAVRGANDLDGSDNLNLPRIAIEPTSMAASAEGARWVLIPYLRSYYVHNGGWFLGQEWGCTGGARVEAMLVVYDRRTGNPAWWQAATGRHVQEMKAQPSRAEMDQFLLWSEDQVEASLGAGFLK